MAQNYFNQTIKKRRQPRIKNEFPKYRRPRSKSKRGDMVTTDCGDRRRSPEQECDPPASNCGALQWWPVKLILSSAECRHVLLSTTDYNA
ncbi:hypothetical protein T10_11968 [Trichinella papuae]|uniref:Uncharacterized protein n=1 Tax=Trichinella papuae TaxID=268474 RepID=A0A0V1MRU9_9BILA|nr:hypothetical protein T10_11968 [Trichinella papuae]